MNLVVDASSAINLHRAGLLQTVLGLTSHGTAFYVGNIVRDECADLREFLDWQAQAGLLSVVADDLVTAEVFQAALELYDLGEGETECIVLAKELNFGVCSDDRAARRAAAIELGEERVVGSLRLLRDCVHNGLLTSNEAFTGYEMMKDRGAFLPCVELEYFEG